MTDGLRLDEPREAVDVLQTAFTLFARHAAIFFTLTLAVVAPVTILLDGVWGGTLADGGDADPPPASVAVSLLVGGLVVPTFVTALHVRVVQALDRGEVPTVGAAFRSAVPAFGLALGAALLYALAVLTGFVALIVPGIYLAVRLFFATQAAVVEERPGVEALKRSAELTKGLWWRTFGCLLLIGLAINLPIGLLQTAVSESSDNGLWIVLVAAVGGAVATSLTALGGTLLFFDTRARQQPAPSFAPPVGP